MTRKALVVGATGLVGRELVNILLNDEGYDKVTVLVRNGMDSEHFKLDQQLIDFEQLENISPDLISGAVIFCALGTTMKKAKTKEAFKRVDYEYPLILGRLAKRYDAEQMLIVTAMGANAKSLFFYNQVKGQVEEELTGLGLRSLSIYRPSLLIGNRQETRIGETMAAKLAKAVPLIFKGKLTKFKPVAGRTVALAMARTAALNKSGIAIFNSDSIEAIGGWRWG